jgi:hypothetical protein
VNRGPRNSTTAEVPDCTAGISIIGTLFVIVGRVACIV